MLIRTRLVPKIGHQMQRCDARMLACSSVDRIGGLDTYLTPALDCSPLWLADGFLVGYSAVAACLLMLSMVFISFATRFLEYGFRGYFR